MSTPGAAVLGVIALLPLRRYRVRGERRGMADFRQQHVGSSKLNAIGLWAGLSEAASILREDRSYRRYMVAQFTLGAANFFTDPVLVTVITGRLMFGYLASNLIMQVIPGVVVLGSIHLWARHFDRVGVLQFRVDNCLVWVAAYTLVAVSMLIIGLSGGGMLWLAIPILVIARVLKGTAHGGGTIAWSLGHLHFSRTHQADLYMSIHVALTGVRALIMPLLGALAHSLLGYGSFAIAIVISGTALVLYRRLTRADPAPKHAAETAARRQKPPATNADVS